jgi:hypothetical protein
MKLTDKTCPRLIVGEVFLDRASCPQDYGAHLELRSFWHNGRQVVLRLKVDDYVLRQLAELVEKTAKARAARAAYLRGGSE